MKRLLLATCIALMPIYSNADEMGIHNGEVFIRIGVGCVVVCEPIGATARTNGQPGFASLANLNCRWPVTA
jgi:hypothetical protein